MTLFYALWPGAVYAEGPIEAASEADLRAWFRETHKLRRLPAGFAVWKTDGRVWDGERFIQSSGVVRVPRGNT